MSGSRDGGIEEAQPVRANAAIRIGVDRDIANLPLDGVLDGGVADGDFADGLGHRLAAGLSRFVGNTLSDGLLSVCQLAPIMAAKQVAESSESQSGNPGVGVHCAAGCLIFCTVFPAT